MFKLSNVKNIVIKLPGNIGKHIANVSSNIDTVLSNTFEKFNDEAKNIVLIERSSKTYREYFKALSESNTLKKLLDESNKITESNRSRILFSEQKVSGDWMYKPKESIFTSIPIENIDVDGEGDEDDGFTFKFE